MFDIEAINKQIGGVGNNIHAIRKGKHRAQIVQADGTKTKVLSPVKYSKDSKENVLSLTADMTAGAKLSSSLNKHIQLVYPDSNTVMFGRRIKTRYGWASRVDIVPISGQEAEEERILSRLKTRATETSTAAS